MPSLKRAFLSMCGRGRAYIIKAGTIILLCNAAVYVMQSFNWNLQMVEEGAESTSILASVAGGCFVAVFAAVLVCLCGHSGRGASASPAEAAV